MQAYSVVKDLNFEQAKSMQNFDNFEEELRLDCSFHLDDNNLNFSFIRDSCHFLDCSTSLAECSFLEKKRALEITEAQ